MMLSFLENAFNLCILTYTPVPHSSQNFFDNMFTPTAERNGKNYDLLYQNLYLYKLNYIYTLYDL